MDLVRFVVSTREKASVDEEKMEGGLYYQVTERARMQLSVDSDRTISLFFFSRDKPGKYISDWVYQVKIFPRD